MIREQLKCVYEKKSAYIITFASAIIIGSIFYLMSDYTVIFGNLGQVYGYIEVIFQVLVAMLFGINVALVNFRIRHTSKITGKSAASVALGSALPLLVAGCPACGITLASYIGLAAVMATLPFYGLELKLLGVILLLFSGYQLLKPVQCKLK